MDIQVVEKNEISVVGISWNGTYSQINTIPHLFEEMEARLKEVSNQKNSPVLIAPFHRRETEFTYYVTTPVEKLEEIPEGMIGFTIPSKNYVCSVHRGSLEEVENTYQQMLEWMNEYGYDLDDHALSLEVFKEDYKNHIARDNFNFEIYLPVKTYKDND